MVLKSPRCRLRVTAAPPLSPTLLRDTVKKVDKCMARLQELQHTVAAGLTPPTNTRISETCSLIKKEDDGQRSYSYPLGKLPDEWRRMSLSSMLIGETMHEIVQSSRVLKIQDPTTPPSERRKKTMIQHSQLIHSRRKREKHRSSESDAQRGVKSRIIFDPPRQLSQKQNCIANRVSPRNRPWATKTVLFPNPLFQPSSPKSPLIAPKNRLIPHKLLIKSPRLSSSLQVKIKRSEPDCFLVKKSTNAVAKSFSPSELAKRLVSPMRKSVQTSGKMMNIMMSGLKQRPTSMTVRVSNSRV